MIMEEFIKKLPKAELNIHLEGSLEPSLMLALAKKNNIQLPYANEQEILNAYQFKDLKSFLDVYYLGLSVLVTEQDFYELAYQYLQKAAAENIRHSEIFFDPQAHLARGVAFETIIKGLHKASVQAEKEFKISSFLIMCFMRDLTEAAAEQVFDMALPYKDLIVAVGLDSVEKNNPPEKFANVFKRARDNGFLAVAIAGETGPPEYIWQAIDVLKVSRIDHGVHCIEDPDLLAKLAATQIPLTICPISNIKLGIFPSMRQHPLKKMYEDGLLITINSDDPAYFRAYLNDNFYAINSALKLNKSILCEFAKNSFYASFLDYGRRDKLLLEVEKFYKVASQS